MSSFSRFRSLGFGIVPPQTLNVGASFGPRVSTAGFEIRSFGMPDIRLRLYADLDGLKWQDDRDVTRRGAHAVVPFAKRASSALREGNAEVETGADPRHPGIYETAIVFRDSVEGFERRLQANIRFRGSEKDDLSAIEARWVAKIAELALRMGTDIHVAVHDPANSNVFQVSKRSA